MFNRPIEIIHQPRIKILETLKDFSLEQLNKIPEGFNNNIIWNLGHMVAAQQGVCYKRAGLEIWVDDDFFQAYKPDSKPTGFVDQEGYEKIKSLFFTSLEQLEKDYKSNIFTNYPAWSTRYGVEMTSIDEAIAYLPFHEGLHVGYIMAMRKLV